jgi:hypothetical protein
LIDSLDPAVDEGAESAWEQEIARRISDLDSGRAKTVPWKRFEGGSHPSFLMANKKVESGMVLTYEPLSQC